MKIHIYPKSMLETVWQQDKLLFTPEAEQPPLCLRCGQPLDHRLVINALSRYADVHICEACGMDEALRDANRCPLPLTEWAAVKNGLSQQQTDFEAPLLTTSCTFEDLFQQGSRPASEPTEFNLYSETAHFYIWLRLITRRRDYNAYVHYYLKG